MKSDTLKTKLITQYMEQVLEHETYPKSVYKFCKTAKIEEKDFYNVFSSLDAVREYVWEVFFTNAMQVLEKDKDFKKGSRREKLLSFYFTFFEVLLLNRSYVLFALKREMNIMKDLVFLKRLRLHFKVFATDLIEEGNADKDSRWSQHPPKLFSEAAWAQLLFLMKFWIEDTSEQFEKTDAAIEKSVNTAFDVFDNTPLDTLLDFGKFLWKETVANT
ncbi:MAG TPA: heat-shock protein [Flavobacteriaceae bacterium]|nr:heat-shock protein [Flavobacteriaceae bacterium]|tara:strand:- start:11585 stop:12235 length:651 start_codon:yes stop_codon:yes gene_type:complete